MSEMSKEELLAIKKIQDDDAAMIPNVGDTREVHQTGIIHKTDGTSVEVPVIFKRTRNEAGGVDVVAQVQAPFAIHGKVN